MEKPLFATIINDCASPNDFGRQVNRVYSLFGGIPVNTVTTRNTYEAAGHLVDMLDASNGQAGMIFVNVAPRNGQGKKWPNGTPFGYFTYKNILVISTIDGYCLSLVKKLGLIDILYLTDVPRVVDEMTRASLIEEDLRDHIIRTQFRSFEYVPRLAKMVIDELPVSSQPYSINRVDFIPHVIWFVDEFGNCKTTILPEEIDHAAGKIISTTIGDLPCYDRLKDVPDAKPGLIVGSSGLRLQRFLEVVVQGGSAAKKFNLHAGSWLIQPPIL